MLGEPIKRLEGAEEMNFKNLVGGLSSFLYFGILIFLLIVNTRSGPFSENGIVSMIALFLLVIGFGAGYFAGIR